MENALDDSKALHAELILLRALRRLSAAADDALEIAFKERLSLAPVLLERLLPMLAEHTKAIGATAYSVDEDLQPRFFHWTADGTAELDEQVWQEVRDGVKACRWHDGAIIARPFDVAGEDFGFGAVVFAEAPSADERAFVGELLGQWCEEVDDYLAVIARSRLKHRLTSKISDALKEPVLSEGIDAAVALLADEIGFDDLILVFRRDDGGGDIFFKVFAGAKLCHDSAADGSADSRITRLLHERGPSLIANGDQDIPRRLGMNRYREEVLINGVKNQRTVGRLLVSRESGDFSTFDRDLLERFADFLRQRIVDFNREHKQLSECFGPQQVARLLRHPDYARHYLEPREEEVAVMFCDISGFTRISERVLREPALIGRLVDTWAEQAVASIWAHGGVLDKMVGDCIIGLWAPPFFDIPAGDCCRGALEAAKEIRDFTRRLGEVSELWPDGHLDQPIGVGTGLNHCRLFVGRFGPDDDYTGFSSGMNATARLQGLAGRDEILCMDGFLDALGGPDGFGPMQQAQVKNVAEPLVYAALLGDR